MMLKNPGKMNMPFRTKVFCTLTLSLMIAVSLTFSEQTQSQQNVPVPIKLEKAFILKVDADAGKLLVDLGDNIITTDESVSVNINSKTVFLNKKKKPVDVKLLRPGVLLEIDGEKSGTDVTANKVTVLTNLEEWQVNIDGYFEKLDGDTAEIDGQRVKLAGNSKIKGASEWKGKDFKSFNEMMLGVEAKVKGIRKSDGIVYATEITTEPNDFTKNEKELRLKLSQNLALNGMEADTGLVKNLSNGTVVIGGQKFKLVENLDVQTYVNKVGFKLVPRYIKDLERHDPAKLSFRFYVVEDNSPNAFAFADGSVFIHTGLLRILKNEAQLASVIGHEMAHATHEHTRRTLDSVLTKTLGIGEKTGLLSNGDLITFGLGIFANKFSRAMENQADRVGLRYMYDAGYDPRESPKVWREMDRLLKNAASEKPSGNTAATGISIIDLIPKGSKAKVDNFLYSSHPEAVARLKNLNREIAYNYYDTDFGQTKVKADEYKEALGYYFGWIKKPVRPQVNQTPTNKKTPTNTTKTPTKTTKPKKKP